MSCNVADSNELIRREALASAGINFLINMGINALMLRGEGPHILTVDSIASKEHTVFGSAVPLAVILSLILATITFFTFRKKAAALKLAPQALLDRPYFFFGLRHAVAAALFMFGAVVAAGVLWQRLFGSLTVTTPVAAAIAGLVAAVASAYACVSTSRALLREG